MTEKNFIQRAIALALEKMREDDGGPFGAVIVRDDTIIAEGWNQVTRTNDPTAHAEIVAIREACECSALSTPMCDVLRSAEPCPMCLGAIYWARLRRVFYANTRVEAAQIGFDDSFIYDQVALPPEQRENPTVRMMIEEAREAFQEWAASPDKIDIEYLRASALPCSAHELAAHLACPLCR